MRVGLSTVPPTMEAGGCLYATQGAQGGVLRVNSSALQKFSLHLGCDHARAFSCTPCAAHGPQDTCNTDTQGDTMGPIRTNSISPQQFHTRFARFRTGPDCVCPALYQRRRDFVAYPIGATLHSFARNHTHSFIPGQCLEILRRASHGSVHDIGVHSCATKVIRSQISYASSRSMQILHCCVLIAEMACCA